MEDSLRRNKIDIIKDDKLIEYKYIGGYWTKSIDYEIVCEGNGYKFNEFLEEVLNEYPLNEVENFNIFKLSE